MLAIKDHEAILSTGKTFYTHQGIMGISCYEGRFRISEGYDGGIDEEFTQEEKAEIAEHNIELWKSWALKQ